MNFAVAILGGMLTFLIMLSCGIAVRKSMSFDIFRRLRRHHIREVKRAQPQEDLYRKVYRFLKRAARPFVNLNLFAALDFKIKQAGLPLLGAEFIIAVLIGSTAAALLTYMMTLDTILAAIAAIAVPIAATMLIRTLIDRRKEAFTEQLSDCLTTVANALRAGYSFQQAMDVIAKEMEPPISTEFAKVTTDVTMGVPLEIALEQMNQRVGSADFELVVTAVLIQREVGGNLAQILDTISDTINERIRMKREIMALTAQGRFSAMILLVLPFAVAGIMYVLNGNQMKLLFEESSGQMAIGIALVMEFIGFLVIRKIVDIDV